MIMIIPPTPPTEIEMEVTEPEEIKVRGKKLFLGDWSAYAVEVVAHSPDQGRGSLIYVPNVPPRHLAPTYKGIQK